VLPKLTNALLILPGCANLQRASERTQGVRRESGATRLHFRSSSERTHRVRVGEKKEGAKGDACPGPHTQGGRGGRWASAKSAGRRKKYKGCASSEQEVVAVVSA